MKDASVCFLLQADEKNLAKIRIIRGNSIFVRIKCWNSRQAL